MIQGKYLYYGDEDLEKAYEIRKKVFVEELGVLIEEEFDDIDKEAVHAIVYDVNNKNKTIATGRVFFNGVNYKIDKVAVLKDERNKYYGDFVVRLLANKAFLAGAQEIFLNTQVSNLPFYEKIGFKAFGEKFNQSGIEYTAAKLVSGSLCQKCDKK